MTYTLIGTGNMAWFLAGRLYKQGFTCAGIYGRDSMAAKKLSSEVHTQTIKALTDLPETDCCIVCVNDQSIPEITEQLALEKTTIIHTAGSVNMNIIRQKNAAVLWPIYSINKNRLPEHRNIPLVYEYTTETAGEIVSKLAYLISDIVQEVSGKQRQWLHLCAVLGNNFTNHLMAVCELICREQDLPFSLIRPIILQTFNGVTDIEPSLVQTGPAKRKDRETIDRHVELLQQHPKWQKLYEAISASIEDMYKTH